MRHPALQPALIPRVAERLRALADENRIRLILRLGEGPCRVTHLAEELELAQASVSKHLAVLRHAGLVTAERRGTEAIYRIHDESVFELCNIVCGGVQRHLEEQAAVLSPAPRTRRRKTVTRSTRANRVNHNRNRDGDGDSERK